MIDKQAGPVIGIMTALKSDGTVAGNGELFIKLQKKLISLNGISFIFTLEGAGAEYIEGFSYSPVENRWIRNSFPYPDLVYNRIPFRKTEQTEECKSFFQHLRDKGIPYFNPGFINKYELYQLMENHPVLQDYVPKTILLQEKKDLELLLKANSSVYLKPAASSKGKGVFRVRHLSSPYIQFESRKRSICYPSFEDFWQDWSELLLSKTYLAQIDINSAEYEGFRYDFRIIAHAEKEDYSLTGVGIRQSQEQGVTTHIPSGGRLLPYSLLQTNEHDQFFQMIIPHIGKALSEQLGFFGEFSIDAGMSKSGKYYIYEVNSKPMRFDESQIEEKKIDQLCRIFLHLTSSCP